jgi:hypothetical protein
VDGLISLRAEVWRQVASVRRKLRLDGARPYVSPYRRPSSTSVGRRGKSLTRHPGGADESRTSAGPTGYIFRRRSAALDRRDGSDHGYIATPSWEQEPRLNTDWGEPMDHKSAPAINPPSGPCPDSSHLGTRLPTTNCEPEKRDASSRHPKANRPPRIDRAATSRTGSTAQPDHTASQRRLATGGCERFSLGLASRSVSRSGAHASLPP